MCIAICLHFHNTRVDHTFFDSTLSIRSSCSSMLTATQNALQDFPTVSDECVFSIMNCLADLTIYCSETKQYYPAAISQDDINVIWDWYAYFVEYYPRSEYKQDDYIILSNFENSVESLLDATNVAKDDLNVEPLSITTFRSLFCEFAMQLGQPPW